MGLQEARAAGMSGPEYARYIEHRERLLTRLQVVTRKPRRSLLEEAYRRNKRDGEKYGINGVLTDMLDEAKGQR